MYLILTWKAGPLPGLMGYTPLSFAPDACHALQSYAIGQTERERERERATSELLICFLTQWAIDS